MTIPNFITIARLIAVPVLILLLLDGNHAAAFALFVLAGVSDAIDGIIARYVPGQASDLGAYLDPIADKALLVSIFITLGIIGDIPAWLVITVVSRDLLIVGGVMLAWMLSNPVTIDPLKISKATTAAQIVFVAVVLADFGLGWRIPGAAWVLALVVAALTAGSAAAYVIAWVRHMGPRRAG